MGSAGGRGVQQQQPGIQRSGLEADRGERRLGEGDGGSSRGLGRPPLWDPPVGPEERHRHSGWGQTAPGRVLGEPAAGRSGIKGLHPSLLCTDIQSIKRLLLRSHANRMLSICRMLYQECSSSWLAKMPTHCKCESFLCAETMILPY